MSEREAEKEEPSPPPRVMLIDDESAILQALQRELRREPLRLQAFTDPKQALEEASRESFALIISDNMMPGLTGLELLAQVASHQPQTRRILLTGRTNLEQAVRAFNEGHIHRFIQKPWDKGDLLGAIHAELEHYRAGLEEQQALTELATVSRKRTEQLKRAIGELKQMQTQVFLHEEGSVSSRTPLSPRMKRLAVLVVEAHAAIRELIVTSFKKAGIANVQAVGSGDEAITFLQSSPPVDVILSEWNLAPMDGLTLFQTIRASQFQSSEATFILVTARDNRQAVDMALKAGVNGYVIKPFHLKNLITQIEGLLPKSYQTSVEDQIRDLRALSFIVANADLESRFQIQNLLVGSGIQKVMMADSGQKALRVLDEKQVEVLIYDCNIRDPYWIDLEPAVRELQNPRTMPALVLTSVAPMPKEFEEVNRQGLQSFLPGAVSRRKLFDAVQRAREMQMLFDPPARAGGNQSTL